MLIMVMDNTNTSSAINYVSILVVKEIIFSIKRAETMCPFKRHASNWSFFEVVLWSIIGYHIFNCCLPRFASKNLISCIYFFLIKTTETSILLDGCILFC